MKKFIIISMLLNLFAIDLSWASDEIVGSEFFPNSTTRRIKESVQLRPKNSSMIPSDVLSDNILSHFSFSDLMPFYTVSHFWLRCTQNARQFKALNATMREIADKYSSVTVSNTSGNSNILYSYLKAVPECKIYFTKLWLQGFPLRTIQDYGNLPLLYYTNKGLTEKGYEKIRTLWLEPYLGPLNSKIYQLDSYFTASTILGILFCQLGEEGYYFSDLDDDDEFQKLIKNKELEKFKDLVSEMDYLLGCAQIGDRFGKILEIIENPETPYFLKTRAQLRLGSLIFNRDVPHNPLMPQDSWETQLRISYIAQNKEIIALVEDLFWHHDASYLNMLKYDFFAETLPILAERSEQAGDIEKTIIYYQHIVDYYSLSDNNPAKLGSSILSRALFYLDALHYLADYYYECFQLKEMIDYAEKTYTYYNKLLKFLSDITSFVTTNTKRTQQRDELSSLFHENQRKFDDLHHESQLRLKEVKPFIYE